MTSKPITFRTACDFIALHHRHHKPTVGCKFSIGLYEENALIGVAVCGRPVSRHLDDGLTCEINRLCVVDGHYNACSMLYGACCRIAKEMGYEYRGRAKKKKTGTNDTIMIMCPSLATQYYLSLIHI